jgi:hypothetical protein
MFFWSKIGLCYILYVIYKKKLYILRIKIKKAAKIIGNEKKKRLKKIYVIKEIGQ